MSKYQIHWHEDIYNDLKSIDRNDAKRIIKKIEEYLSFDPIGLGKPLTGEFKGFYRYRFGDYRVIYSLHNEIRIMHIMKIGNRKNIYH
jgi:mRNA interferase RelE/StbE